MYSLMIEMAAHGYGKEAEQAKLLMAGITDWGGNLADWGGQIHSGPTHGQFDKAIKQGLLTIHDKIDEEAGKWFFGLGRLFDGQYKDRADKFVPPLMAELVPNIGKTTNFSGRIKAAIIAKFGAMAKTLAHENIKEIIDQQEKAATAAAKTADKPAPTPVAAQAKDGDTSWNTYLSTTVNNVEARAKAAAAELAPTVIPMAEKAAQFVIDKKIDALTKHMEALPFDQLLRMDVSQKTMMNYFTDIHDSFPGHVSEKTYRHEVGSLTARVHQIGKRVIEHMKAQKEKEIRAVAEPLIAGCLKDDQCAVPTKKELERAKRNAARGTLGHHAHADKYDAKSGETDIKQAASRVPRGRGMFSTP